MKAIVVGAGGATRDLLRRLADLWDVTVVDTDEQLLELASSVRKIGVVHGDGSSRVTLERAGLADADAVVAATSDDEINLEICRLALRAGMLRVSAVAANPERLPDYRELGISAFSPDSLTARQVEITLEPRRIASTAFADGRAEAIEFRIAPDSPVRGMALKDLHSASWLVAAILRSGELIVPHGDTVIEAGDLVTVVGAAADFSLIVRTFTSGEARFPIDGGKGVAVTADAPLDAQTRVGEAAALTRASVAEVVVVAHPPADAAAEDPSEHQELLEAIEQATDGVDVKLRPLAGSAGKRIATLLESESVGVIVVQAPAPGRLQRIRVVRALRQAVKWGRPVLFARGTHPYATIVAPARETAPGEAAARAAIDIAGVSKGSVTALAVVPPVFLTGSDGRDAGMRALARMREEAAVLEVPVRRLLRQGNPVRVLASVAEGADLVVLGTPSARTSLFRPGIVGHVLERVECSVLVVPPAAS